MTETITVTGNVATPPEQRPVGEGASVTSFRLAAPHRRFDRNTQRWVEQYTNFYSVSAFRALGAHALASLRQGDRVIVSGRLRLRAWDNGTKSGTTAEIDAESIGHDLLFGTTTYRRDDAERPAAAGGAGGESTEPRNDEAWSVPGTAMPAGAGTGAETPF